MSLPGVRLSIRSLHAGIAPKRLHSSPRNKGRIVASGMHFSDENRTGLPPTVAQNARV